MPARWAFKHGAYYYRTRNSERDLFDGKAWFRLGKDYPSALRAFADRKELEHGESLSGSIDRYRIEVLPRLKPNTQRNYSAALERLRKGLGHNRAQLIMPVVVYQYMDEVSKVLGMNLANTDLKVLVSVLDYCVRWGVVITNPIKRNVSYYGVRDGVKRSRDRYVDDWELAEWQKVATPIQKAFAALVLLLGTRKCDTLRIRRSADKGNTLEVFNSKTNKAQVFNVTPALRAAIDTAKDACKVSSVYILANQTGQCFVGDDDRCASFDKAWRRSMTRAISETRLEQPFTRHDLRAKVGSDADSEGRAQQLLGHTTAAMTRKHYRRKVQAIDPAK
jgi:integrase